MEFRKSITGAACNIALTGKFTFADHSSFRSVLETAKDVEISSITLDVSCLDFIDSAGLGMLLLLREEVNKRGSKIGIHRPQGQVQKMFQISKFDTLFNVTE